MVTREDWRLERVGFGMVGGVKGREIWVLVIGCFLCWLSGVGFLAVVDGFLG